MNSQKQTVPHAQPPWVGQPLQRKEETRLVRGKGKFVDDIQLRDMLYLQFARSPYAHAEIKSVDVSAAEQLPGVICTLMLSKSGSSGPKRCGSERKSNTSSGLRCTVKSPAKEMAMVMRRPRQRQKWP